MPSPNQTASERAHCCIDKGCMTEPAEFWFTVEIVCSDEQLHFCPAHSLAAELLVSLGLGAEQVRARLQAFEDCRRATIAAKHPCKVNR